MPRPVVFPSSLASPSLVRLTPVAPDTSFSWPLLISLFSTAEPNSVSGASFLALPGGMGTLEEIFEVWTWRQIGLLDKPVGFLDAGGFWTPLLDSLRGLGEAGFMSQASLDDVVVAPDLDGALAGLEARGVGSRLLTDLT